MEVAYCQHCHGKVPVTIVNRRHVGHDRFSVIGTCLQCGKGVSFWRQESIKKGGEYAVLDREDGLLVKKITK